MMTDPLKLKGKRVDTDGWCGVEALTFVEFILTDNPKAVLMDSLGNIRVTALDRIRFIEAPKDQKVGVMREALEAIDKHPTGANSEPDSMADALDQIHAIAKAALDAAKEGA